MSLFFSLSLFPFWSIIELKYLFFDYLFLVHFICGWNDHLFCFFYIYVHVILISSSFSTWEQYTFFCWLLFLLHCFLNSYFFVLSIFVFPLIIYILLLYISFFLNIFSMSTFIIYQSLSRFVSQKCMSMFFCIIYSLAYLTVNIKFCMLILFLNLHSVSSNVTSIVCFILFSRILTSIFPRTLSNVIQL